MLNQHITRFEGFIDMGQGHAFSAESLPLAALLRRRMELTDELRKIDWQDYWTQSDREFRKLAAVNLYRINNELEKRGVTQ